MTPLKPFKIKLFWERTNISGLALEEENLVSKYITVNVTLMIRITDNIQVLVTWTELIWGGFPEALISLSVV